MTLYILFMLLNGHAVPLQGYLTIADCRASQAARMHDNEAASYECQPLLIDRPTKRVLYGKI